MSGVIKAFSSFFQEADSTIEEKLHAELDAIKSFQEQLEIMEESEIITMLERQKAKVNILLISLKQIKDSSFSRSRDNELEKLDDQCNDLLVKNRSKRSLITDSLIASSEEGSDDNEEDSEEPSEDSDD